MCFTLVDNLKKRRFFRSRSVEPLPPDTHLKIVVEAIAGAVVVRRGRRQLQCHCRQCVRPQRH